LYAPTRGAIEIAQPKEGNMEQVHMALEPARIFFVQLGEFLPRLLLAIIILVAGWLLAKALKFAVLKGLRAVNLNVLTERAGVDGFLRQGGIDTDTVGILAILIYWLAMLASLVVAFNTLGLGYVTDLLIRVALFIPHVIVAVLILAFGAYFARFIDTSISAYGKNVGLEDVELLGRLARYTVMVFVVFIALDQVNVGGDFVRQTFLIVLTGVVLALALAFGLGGQKLAGQLLARWSRESEADDAKPKV
jgi:Conserved TM helix